MRDGFLKSGLALLTGVLFAAPLAADGFNDRSIRGTWSLFVQGHTAMGNAFGVPAGTALAAVATVTFDGRGGCESVDQIVLGGQFIPARDGFRDTREGGRCSYQVNGDGTGLFDVVFPDTPPTNATFVISNRNQMRFIASNPDLGIFGAGEMKRQRGGGGNHDD